MQLNVMDEASRGPYVGRDGDLDFIFAGPRQRGPIFLVTRQELETDESSSTTVGCGPVFHPGKRELVLIS